MELSKYCLKKGMSKEMFFETKKQVAEKAEAAIALICKNPAHGMGMYFPTTEIIEQDYEFSFAVINALKEKGVEFIENGSLYRY